MRRSRGTRCSDERLGDGCHYIGGMADAHDGLWAARTWIERVPDRPSVKRKQHVRLHRQSRHDRHECDKGVRAMQSNPSWVTSLFQDIAAIVGGVPLPSHTRTWAEGDAGLA